MSEVAPLVEHAQRSAHDSEQREPTTERPVPHSPLVRRNAMLVKSLDSRVAVHHPATLRTTQRGEQRAVEEALCSCVQARATPTIPARRGYRVVPLIVRGRRSRVL